MAREKTLGVSLSEEEHKEVIAYLLDRSMKLGKRISASAYTRELLLANINNKDAKQDKVPDAKQDIEQDAKQDEKKNLFSDINF